jgi:hypothetical protein
MQTGLFVYQFKEGGITMSRQEEAKLTEMQERLDQALSLEEENCGTLLTELN